MNEALAQEAVACARPLFDRSVQSHDFGESGAAHIVIMKPGSSPRDSSFEEAILYEESFGDVPRWDADYAAYARAKAKLAWTTQRDSQFARDAAPQLLAIGDTLLGGGVYIDGMTVAVSGMQAWFDEALAATVAWFLRALAKREVASRGKAAVV
ncbi:MAG: hypothetical protein ACM3SS_09240 [Rhodospirillaceae bacterium]